MGRELVDTFDHQLSVQLLITGQIMSIDTRIDTSFDTISSGKHNWESIMCGQGVFGDVTGDIKSDSFTIPTVADVFDIMLTTDGQEYDVVIIVHPSISFFTL